MLDYEFQEELINSLNSISANLYDIKCELEKINEKE